MKSNYTPLLAILLIAVFFMSGCASQESPTKAPTTTQPAETPKTTPPATQPTAPSGIEQRQITESSKSVPQIKQEALNVTYDTLFRNNERYIGKTIYFKGQIVQIQEISTNNYILRVATKESSFGSYFEDVIFVNYEGKRLLEDDIIEIWGKVEGLKSYTAVLGNEVTIPEMKALHTELSQKAAAKTPEQYEEKYNQNAKISGEIIKKGNFEITLVNYGFYTHLKYDTWGDEVTDFRVDLKVKNAGSEKDSFSTYDGVIISGSNQYERSFNSNLDSSNVYPGIIKEGYLIFEDVPKTLTGQIKIITGTSYDASYNKLTYEFNVQI